MTPAYLRNPSRLLLAFSLFAATCQAFGASPFPVAAENGMVVTAQHLATKVGVDVLKKGGNAIDAAVAVGYALAVVFQDYGVRLGRGAVCGLGQAADAGRLGGRRRRGAGGGPRQAPHRPVGGEVIWGYLKQSFRA